MYKINSVCPSFGGKWLGLLLTSNIQCRSHRMARGAVDPPGWIFFLNSLIIMYISKYDYAPPPGRARILWGGFSCGEFSKVNHNGCGEV
jgi:hypothetical protein